MRRSILKKLAASAALVTAIIFSGQSVFAQHRSHNDEHHHHDKKGYSKRSNDHKRNKNADYHSRHKQRKDHHHGTYTKVKTRHYRGDHYHGDRVIVSHYGHRPSKHSYRSHGHHKHAYHKHGHHKHVTHHYYKHQGHRCYSHPSYGNVVVSFAAAPVVINHCDGDFYYTQGVYYRYYPEIGYVMVEAPSSVCFDEIPDACERVSYHGKVYFKFGDLCFVKDRRGFRIAGSVEL